jgi:hypothetical protein
MNKCDIDVRCKYIDISIQTMIDPDGNSVFGIIFGQSIDKIARREVGLVSDLLAQMHKLISCFLIKSNLCL